jgi:inorganic pyrophosphatase
MAGPVRGLLSRLGDGWASLARAKAVDRPSSSGPATHDRRASRGCPTVIIEVSIGGEPIKYEMDKAAGTLVVDRFLYTPMRYPGNYGFVPHTLSEDGDPIDVLVANTRPIIPGAVINVRPSGVFQMQDDGGMDEKIIAVPTPKLTRRYVSVKNYTDLPPISLEQIQHFFEHYKDLEPGKWVKSLGWGNREQAMQYIRDAIKRHDDAPD